MHLLQVLFKRHLRNLDLTLNTKHLWVWILHIPVYLYVAFMYFYDRSLGERGDPDPRRKVWVALDLMLTVGILFYYSINIYAEQKKVEGELYDDNYKPPLF